MALSAVDADVVDVEGRRQDGPVRLPANLAGILVDRRDLESTDP
jgi:hypothetical protein